MTKFLEIGVKRKNLEREMSANIKNFDYPFHETKILQMIDYNLTFMNAFGICNFILYNGIICSDESVRNIEEIDLSCLYQLNAFGTKNIFSHSPI